MSEPSDGTWRSSTVLPPKMRPAPSSTTTTSTLKRPFSMLSGSTIPEIPRLQGDILLEVFTHSSLRFEGAPSNEEYGDNKRLAELGATALETAVTFTLFAKRPMLSADDIKTQREEYLSDANLETWLSNYRLREKVRCAQDSYQSISSPKESRLLFHSYVGAVFAQQGPRVVQNWISLLVDPESEPPSFGPMGTPEPPPQLYPQMTPKRSRVTASPPYPHINMDQAFASPQPEFVPAAPMFAPPATSAPSVPQMSYLQLFNQTANQRRVGVDYPAEFSGPPHAGMWMVKCVVNGVEKGSGSGQSKQVAKEDAARQAFVAMGWGPGPASAPTRSTGSPYSFVSASPAPSASTGYNSFGGDDVQMKTEPAEPAMPPPPLPNPLAPAEPSKAFLPLFNQTATQRRHNVEYPAVFNGPPHAGNWQVKCVVDGIEKGQGQGMSKQLAKEEAARQAYYNMGWAPRA